MDIDRISILISLDFFYGFLCFTTRLMPQKHKETFAISLRPHQTTSLRFLFLIESFYKAVEMEVMHALSDETGEKLKNSHFNFMTLSD